MLFIKVSHGSTHSIATFGLRVSVRSRNQRYIYSNSDLGAGSSLSYHKAVAHNPNGIIVFVKLLLLEGPLHCPAIVRGLSTMQSLFVYSVTTVLP